MNLPTSAMFFLKRRSECPTQSPSLHRPKIVQLDLSPISRLRLRSWKRKSNQIALGINRLGAEPGTRLALMVPPGIEFVALVFGLFKAGIVVILIDPGMGRKNMVRCLSEARPQGVVGIGLAHLMRQLFFYKFNECRHNVSVGGWWPRCHSSTSFENLDPEEFVPHQTNS